MTVIIPINDTLLSYYCKTQHSVSVVLQYCGRIEIYCQLSELYTLKI